MTPPKDAAALAQLSESHDVRGIICVNASAPPATEGLRNLAPTVSLVTGEDGVRPPSAVASFHELIAHCPPRGGAPAATEASLLGLFGGAALTHGQALSLGGQAASKLNTGPSDRVCASITLMHAFGIGSACSSAFSAGACVVLPAVGGIRGCGVPAQRATVTVEVLQSTGATQLFGDTHTLRAMRELGVPPPLALRTGVVKIGSGSTFLDAVREAPGSKGADPLPLVYGGVQLHAIGKA